MNRTSHEVEACRERLGLARAAVAELLRAVHGSADRGAMRGLVRAVRQSLRWATFKVEMLGIARPDRGGAAREQLDVVLATVDDHCRSLRRRLTRR